MDNIPYGEKLGVSHLLHTLYLIDSRTFITVHDKTLRQNL
jgi:hypothetical protein